MHVISRERVLRDLLLASDTNTAFRGKEFMHGKPILRTRYFEARYIEARYIEAQL